MQMKLASILAFVNKMSVFLIWYASAMLLHIYLNTDTKMSSTNIFFLFLYW